MKAKQASLLKKIGSTVIDILVVIVFLVSAVLVVANISTDKKNGETPNVFGYVVNSVQTESMSGTFEKGAIVVGKLVNEDTVINVGDIVTYYKNVNGTIILNTHRVVAIDDTGSIKLYQTQGDNREMCPTPDQDPEWKTIAEIQSVYQFDVPVVGSVIDFLKEPVGFVICLVLPMVAFICWQVYKLIVIYLQSKKAQLLEEAKEGVSDETKDAIIREYLAKMQGEAASNNDSENKE